MTGRESSTSNGSKGKLFFGRSTRRRGLSKGPEERRSVSGSTRARSGPACVSSALEDQEDKNAAPQERSVIKK